MLIISMYSEVIFMYHLFIMLLQIEMFNKSRIQPAYVSVQCNAACAQ